MSKLPVSEDREAGAEHPDVENERGTEVGGESVLRHARDSAGLVEEGVIETGFDHVPSQETLCADEGCHGRQSDWEACCELFSEQEVDGGPGKGEADDASEDAVAPFHVKDTLEFVQ